MKQAIDFEYHSAPTPESPTSVPPTSVSRPLPSGHIQEIDGLRALAVLAVLFFHAQFTGFGGGFVGVDVFFVISGYVVSNAIIKEQDRDHFSLMNFYGRRLKRLAPALYCVLSATLIFSLIFCFPENTLEIVKNIGFITLFYSNVFLSKQTGYFDLAADKQALLHTWSLSVEEQFYLLMPVMLLVLHKWRSRVRLVVVSLLCFAALAWSQHAVTHGIPGAYFQLQTRAFEFLMGVLLAALYSDKTAYTLSFIYDSILAIGLALIAWSVASFTTAVPMPGLQAFWPCLGAVLAIVGSRGARLANRVLTNPPARYIGKISYVLYLWHWPVMFAAKRLGGNHAEPEPKVLELMLTFALAVATHHLIEDPLRRLRWSARKSMVILFALPVVLAGSLVIIGKQTDEFSVFYPAQYRQNYRDSGMTVFHTQRASKCWSKPGITSEADCTVGDISAPEKAVFLGDSHAYQLIDFVDQLGKDHHLAIHDLTFTMCAPVENSPAKAGDPAFQSHADMCRAHGQAVMQSILAQPAIKTVLMSATWDLYANAGSDSNAAPSLHGYMPHEIDRSLSETIGKLEAAGKRVVLFDDIPILPPELEDCVANRIYLPGHGADTCTYSQSYARDHHRVATAILDGVISRHPRVTVIHTYDVPCSDGMCHSELMGTPLYSHNDRGHLGAGGSSIFYRAYSAQRPLELADIFAQHASVALR